MRKVRDFDAELKALSDKARVLKEKRVRQLGELVTATGADALNAETLAGVLLDAAANSDQATREGWRKRGAAFFQGARREPRRRARPVRRDAATDDNGEASSASGPGTG